MCINVGDKLIATKDMTDFFNVGDMIEVTDVNNKFISFTCYSSDTGSHIHIAKSGQMDMDTCNQYFAKVEEEEETEIPAVTGEWIADIMECSEFETYTTFNKCTIVSCKLPNGFVIVESAYNYNAEHAEEICLDKIADRIWELETYRLLNETSDCPYGCNDCEDCPCDECLDVDCYE